MAFLDQYPFARGEIPAKSADVILWWERRRIAYNAIVGATGVITIVLLVVASMVRGDDCGVPGPPIFALLLIVAYGAMANVCYTVGEMTELAGRIMLGKEGASQFARVAFFAGVLLSVVLTISPAVILPLLCLASRSR